MIEAAGTVSGEHLALRGARRTVPRSVKAPAADAAARVSLLAHKSAIGAT